MTTSDYYTTSEGITSSSEGVLSTVQESPELAWLYGNVGDPYADNPDDKWLPPSFQECGSMFGGVEVIPDGDVDLDAFRTIIENMIQMSFNFKSDRLDINLREHRAEFLKAGGDGAEFDNWVADCAREHKETEEQAEEILDKHDALILALKAEEHAQRATGLAPSQVKGSGEFGSWTQEDISDVLDGTITPVETGLAFRSDGMALLYPGEIHDIHAWPGMGKSMIAQWMTAQVLSSSDAGSVLYLDYESSRKNVVSRIRGIGGAVEDLRARFAYVRPKDHPSLDPAGFEGLLKSQPWSLVVIDGVNRSIGLAGGAVDSQEDVNGWIEDLPENIREITGAAVMMVDHVPKGRDSDLLMPIGAQAKFAAITGASYALRPKKGSTRTRDRSVLELVVTKDREDEIQSRVDPLKDDDRMFLVADVTVERRPDGSPSVSVDPPAAPMVPPKDLKLKLRRDNPFNDHMNKVKEERLAPSTTEMVFVLATVFGEEGITENKILDLWSEWTPDHKPRDTSTGRTFFNRAVEQGMLIKATRQSYVADGSHKAAGKAQVVAAIDALKAAITA